MVRLGTKPAGWLSPPAMLGLHSIYKLRGEFLNKALNQNCTKKTRKFLCSPYIWQTGERFLIFHGIVFAKLHIIWWCSFCRWLIRTTGMIGTATANLPITSVKPLALKYHEHSQKSKSLSCNLLKTYLIS